MRSSSGDGFLFDLTPCPSGGIVPRSLLNLFKTIELVVREDSLILNWILLEERRQDLEQETELADQAAEVVAGRGEDGVGNRQAA